MPAKITRDVLESYLNCKYKGHLKLTGQQGTKCDYETLLTETRAEVRLAAIDKIGGLHAGEEILRNIPLNASALKQGASFLLDATLEDDFVSPEFDGLKKVAGPSKLGDFHYIPMLFHEGSKIRNEQKLLLELYGLMGGQCQRTIAALGLRPAFASSGSVSRASSQIKDHSAYLRSADAGIVAFIRVLAPQATQQ